MLFYFSGRPGGAFGSGASGCNDVKKIVIPDCLAGRNSQNRSGEMRKNEQPVYVWQRLKTCVSCMARWSPLAPPNGTLRLGITSLAEFMVQDSSDISSGCQAVCGRSPGTPSCHAHLCLDWLTDWRRWERAAHTCTLFNATPIYSVNDQVPHKALISCGSFTRSFEIVLKYSLDRDGEAKQTKRPMINGTYTLY